MDNVFFLLLIKCFVSKLFFEKTQKMKEVKFCTWNIRTALNKENLYEGFIFLKKTLLESSDHLRFLVMIIADYFFGGDQKHRK